MTPTRILVTGASGFVGGRFLARFRDRPDLLLHGVGRRPLADPDYTSVDLSRRFDLAFEPDVVIHAAARAAPWGTAAEYERDNVEATRQVIDFCRRQARGSQPPRLIYVSSSSVFYTSGPQVGLTEDSPIGPRFVNRYAETKYAGELLVRDYPGPWLVVRPRAVFGPGDTVLFPRLLAAARAGKLPLFTGAPPAVGDLIYIDTLADYLLRAVERPALTGAYNLTNAEPVELRGQLAGVVLHAADRIVRDGPFARTKEMRRQPQDRDGFTHVRRPSSPTLHLSSQQEMVARAEPPHYPQPGKAAI